jgi:hypothetical protein
MHAENFHAPDNPVQSDSGFEDYDHGPLILIRKARTTRDTPYLFHSDLNRGPAFLRHSEAGDRRKRQQRRAGKAD